ncbi:nucleotidyltransferase domain-containing protein, partial [Lamprobacter sp.]|uniref:nucleotidyltransferase domain-containing protein n=1 Tax=Lamprobacter sp. TaxID=3100796 RepID=UPI002B25D987
MGNWRGFWRQSADKMRLTPKQIDIIKQTVEQIGGQDTRTILFGSRLLDDRKGGDIDLLLQSSQPIGLLQRARIKSALEQTLALPVDIIAYHTALPPTPFQRIA